MTEQEFKIMGLTMSQISMIVGAFLIVWAGGFSIGSKSITSWIPAMLGAPILISGILSHFLPAQRKIWMHIAVLFGLFAFLGGFRFFKALGSDAGLFGNPKAAYSQLMLIIVGGAYTFMCVKSFIWARRHTM